MDSLLEACRTSPVEEDGSVFLACNFYPVGEQFEQLFQEEEEEEEEKQLRDTFYGDGNYLRRVRDRPPEGEDEEEEEEEEPQPHLLRYVFTRKTVTRGAITVRWDRVSLPFTYSVLSLRIRVVDDEQPAAAMAEVLALFGWTEAPELAPLARSKFMHLLMCFDRNTYEDRFEARDAVREAMLLSRGELVVKRQRELAHWRAYLWHSLEQPDSCESLQACGWSLGAPMRQQLDKM